MNHLLLFPRTRLTIRRLEGGLCSERLGFWRQVKICQDGGSCLFHRRLEISLRHGSGIKASFIREQRSIYQRDAPALSRACWNYHELSFTCLKKFSICLKHRALRLIIPTCSRYIRHKCLITPFHVLNHGAGKTHHPQDLESVKLSRTRSATYRPLPARFHLLAAIPALLPPAPPPPPSPQTPNTAKEAAELFIRLPATVVNADFEGVSPGGHPATARFWDECTVCMAIME